MLKTKVTEAPVLAHPDEDKKYTLETDASGYAYGGVLSQKQDEDGRLHPVGFMSKSMTPPERRYDIYDKEMLAVAKGLLHSKHLLERTREPIEILTDHKNLEYFKTTRILNSRQARWLQTLSNYNFLIRYRPGTKAGKPDALSRRSDHREEEGGEIDEFKNLTLLKPENFAEIAATGVTDSELTDEIKESIRKDKTLKPIIAFFANGPQDAPAEARHLEEVYEYEDGLLYRHGKVYVPDEEDLKRRLLELYHDSPIAGHQGQAKTLELLSRGYYWPSMKAYVNRYVDGCDKCQRNKSHRTKAKGFLKPLEVPQGPWQDISYDFITHLPVSKGCDAILLVVCRLTKEAHFIPTTEELDALGTAKLLIDRVWKLHGLQVKTVSDSGPQFNSSVLKELFGQLGIKPSFSTAYPPQTDGQTERTNQSVEQYLRLYTSHRQDDWVDWLPLAEFTYNNSVHSTTGMTPFFATR